MLISLITEEQVMLVALAIGKRLIIIAIERAAQGIQRLQARNRIALIGEPRQILPIDHSELIPATSRVTRLRAVPVAGRVTHRHAALVAGRRGVSLHQSLRLHEAPVQNHHPVAVAEAHQAKGNNR